MRDLPIFLMGVVMTNSIAGNVGCNFVMTPTLQFGGISKRGWLYWEGKKRNIAGGIAAFSNLLTCLP